MSELKDSLESFAQECNANERLMAMVKDWNRVLHIHADKIQGNVALAAR